MAALDFPSNPTVGQQYAAPNGVTYQWDGAAWVVTGGPPGQLWTGGTGTLTPTDTTKRVVIPGPTTGDTSPLVFGSRAVKGRLMAAAAADAVALRVNCDSGSVLDDTTKSAWSIQPSSAASGSGDQFNIYHAPPGASAAFTNPLSLDGSGNLTIGANLLFTQQATATHGVLANLGSVGVRLGVNDWFGPPVPATGSWHFGMDATPGQNVAFLWRAPNTAAQTVTHYFNFDQSGNLTISGGTATKASGTTWANPSDERLKRNVEPYAQGLSAILALKPKTFEFNGLGGSQEGLGGIGLIAQDVQPVMPEMVSVTPTKLAPEDAEPVDLLMLDTTALAMALVNAVKELTAEVAALKAAATPAVPTNA